MRLIFANKFYWPSGGQEVYLRELTEILSARGGHEVAPFAMEHPQNWPTPFSSQFVSNMDLKDTSARTGLLQKALLLPKIIYSREADTKIGRLADSFRPDIAHLYGIAFQLTPSIIYSLKRRGIPVVMSVNEYKIVCPNQRLYIMHRYEICERCLFGRYHNAVRQRCIKGSLVASIAGAFETYLYEWLGTYRKHVDAFIVATDYMGNLLKGAGIAPAKIHKLLNPLRLDEYKPSCVNDGYIMYFGRLSEEKGAKTLVKAARTMKDVRVKIVGNGPEEGEMRLMAESAGHGNIEFLGPMWGEKLLEVLAGAKLVVVPSEWYENSPYVVYQSFAMGKPVIGSDIAGGIPELVTDGENGYLFKPGDADSLRETISKALSDEGRLKAMGGNARAFAEERFGEESSYAGFMQVYKAVLGGKAA